MKAGPNPKASPNNVLSAAAVSALSSGTGTAAVVAYIAIPPTCRLHTTAVIRFNEAETLCVSVAFSFATLEVHFDVRRVSGCALAQRRELMRGAWGPRVF